GLGAQAVGAAVPAPGLEDLVGFVDAELPARVGRSEPGRAVEEVRRRLAQAAVELLVNGAAVDQDVQGRAYGGVGQERVSGLDRRTLAVPPLPRVGVVGLNMLDGSARGGVDGAPAAPLGPLGVLPRALG